MPINIDAKIPAYRKLQEKNIFVMTKERAVHQDIRPLNILNLMPQKDIAETQLLRLLTNTPLQINVEFLCVSRDSQHVSKAHMERLLPQFRRICLTQV